MKKGIAMPARKAVTRYFVGEKEVTDKEFFAHAKSKLPETAAPAGSGEPAANPGEADEPEPAADPVE